MPTALDFQILEIQSMEIAWKSQILEIQSIQTALDCQETAVLWKSQSLLWMSRGHTFPEAQSHCAGVRHFHTVVGNPNYQDSLHFQNVGNAKSPMALDFPFVDFFGNPKKSFGFPYASSILHHIHTVKIVILNKIMEIYRFHMKFITES